MESLTDMAVSLGSGILGIEFLTWWNRGEGQRLLRLKKPLLRPKKIETIT